MRLEFINESGQHVQTPVASVKEAREILVRRPNIKGALLFTFIEYEGKEMVVATKADLLK